MMELAMVILEFVKVLALPVALVIVAILLRKDVRGILARVSKATLPGGVNLDFGYETEPLSEEEARRRALLDKKTLVENQNKAASPLLRHGELPTDQHFGDENAFAIESLALTRLESILNTKIEKKVLVKRGESSAIFDGLIPGSENEIDRIVDVQWTRTVNVHGLVEMIPHFVSLVDSYELVTGKKANLLIVLVVPQRVLEVIEHLRPFTQAIEDTHWRVYVEDYDDIGFSVGDDVEPTAN